jgi:hypothetical protein
MFWTLHQSNGVNGVRIGDDSYPAGNWRSTTAPIYKRHLILQSLLPYRQQVGGLFEDDSSKARTIFAIHQTISRPQIMQCSKQELL